VEASALHRQAGIAGLSGRSPLQRLRTDEQLIAATRRGNQSAFETLVQRYQARLLAFCRHMLGSKEDAEDVLQEVFAAAYNALMADERPINTRPWLYRIARNRSLNHLRKPRSAGQDSMDVFERDNGVSTADTVHKREEFRQIVSDVGQLPETQRTALLLREIDALSYEQIAETMDTTVPSVKSLLVRARVSLAEASEARLLTCAEVRIELGEVAEGLCKTSPPVRRHMKACKRCRVFRDELKSTTKALAAIYPIGPLVALKLCLAKVGLGGAAGGGATAGGSGAVAGGAGIAASGATVASSGAAAGAGAISAGIGAISTKAAAGMAAAAIVTAGAVEVRHVTAPERAVAPPAAVSAHQSPPAAKTKEPEQRAPVVEAKVPEPAAVAAPAADPPVVVPAPVEAPAPADPPATVQEEEGTVTLPAGDETLAEEEVPEDGTTSPSQPPPPPPPASTAPAPPPATTPPPPAGDTTAPLPPPPAPG
jgi:RNA polymerase sigma factor (sigma-70 family)